MTPLAHKFASELTLPLKARTIVDPDGMLKRLDDVHCFELTEVVDVLTMLFDGLNGTLGKPGPADRLIFLPAPKTWLEWRVPTGRKAWLLNDLGNGYAEVFYAQDGKSFGCSRIADIPLLGSPLLEKEDPEIFKADHVEDDELLGILLELYAALSLINTPRVIGRRQHMPHAGLQKKLARAKGMTGKYPLHAWSEIRLEVTPPRLDKSAIGEPHETRLTGAKALHFCRCHLRIRLGRLELVSAHWRGDPALGIKQQRYRLTSEAA